MVPNERKEQVAIEVQLDRSTDMENPGHQLLDGMDNCGCDCCAEGSLYFNFGETYNFHGTEGQEGAGSLYHRLRLLKDQRRMVISITMTMYS